MCCGKASRPQGSGWMARGGAPPPFRHETRASNMLRRKFAARCPRGIPAAERSRSDHSAPGSGAGMIGGATSTAVMARHDSREATAAASQGRRSPRLPASNL